MEEIELKLIAGPSFQSSDLEERLKTVGSIAETQAFEQCDTYLDTEQAELVALGLSARVRKKSSGQAVEVKPVPIDAGLVMRRSELRAPVSKKGDPGRTLRKLLARMLGIALDGTAGPVLRLRTERVMHILTTGDTKVEVCFDTVRVGSATDPDVGGFVEVEAEMVEGDEAVLVQIRDALEGMDLQPSGKSKYVRARDVLELPAYDWGAPAPDFDAATAFDAAARKVCAHQLQLIRNHEAGTRIGLDSEHLHKMRVATRRLRTALRVFAAAFARGERRALNRGLRWLGRRLGAVRDLDVALLALPVWRRRFGPAPVAGWDGLTERLEMRRGRARRDLVDALDSSRWTELLELADKSFDRDNTSDAPDTIGRLLDDLLGERLEAFERGVQTFATTRAVDDAHQLRILGKRLRYTVEFLRPALAADVRPQLKALSAFQDELGALQDASAAGAFALRELGQDTDLATAFALGALRGAACADGERAFARVDAALAELDPAGLATQLRAAVTSG